MQLLGKTAELRATPTRGPSEHRAGGGRDSSAADGTERTGGLLPVARCHAACFRLVGCRADKVRRERDASSVVPRARDLAALHLGWLAGWLFCTECTSIKSPLFFQTPPPPLPTPTSNWRGARLISSSSSSEPKQLHPSVGRSVAQL